MKSRVRTYKEFCLSLLPLYDFMHDNAQPFINSSNPYGDPRSLKLPHLAFPLAFVIENFYISNPKRAKTNKQKPPFTSTLTTVRELTLHLMAQRNCTFYVHPRKTKGGGKEIPQLAYASRGILIWLILGDYPHSVKSLITSRRQQPDGWKCCPEHPYQQPHRWLRHDP